MSWEIWARDRKLPVVKIWVDETAYMRSWNLKRKESPSSPGGTTRFEGKTDNKGPCT